MGIGQIARYGHKRSMRDQKRGGKIYHRGTEHTEKKEDAFKKPRKELSAQSVTSVDRSKEHEI